MKIKICVLEDKEEDFSSLDELFRKWSIVNQTKLEVTYFSTTLLNFPFSISDYNLVFFIAKEEESYNFSIIQTLWKLHFHGEIVIISPPSHPTNLSYCNHSIHTLTTEFTSYHIDTILTYIEESLTSSFFIYHHYNTYIRIPYHDIMYFASDNQYTLITSCSKTYRQAGSLKEIADQLPRQFQKCHRTTIVNMCYIQKIIGNQLYLTNGEVLPMSKTYQQNVTSCFMEI